MSAYKLAIYDLFLELLSFKTDFRAIPIEETDATKMKKSVIFLLSWKKKFLPSSRWWFKFLFFFLQEFCFKNTLFNDGTENDFFFFLSNVCMNFPWTFFCLSSFFQNKNLIFFSYVIESSDLCAVVKYFFSLSLWFGYFVVTIWGRLSGLKAWKNFQTFQSLWFTSFITFEKILQIWRIKEFAVLISRVFFFFFSLAEQSKKTEITEQLLLELLLQHASAFQLQVLRCYLLHASAMLIWRFQEIAKICFENRQNNWRLFTLTYTQSTHLIFPKREWVLECLEWEII